MKIYSLSVQVFVVSRIPDVSGLTFPQDEVDQVLINSKLDITALRTLDILSCPSELLEGDGLLDGLLDLVTGLLGGVLGGLLG